MSLISYSDRYGEQANLEKAKKAHAKIFEVHWKNVEIRWKDLNVIETFCPGLPDNITWDIGGWRIRRIAKAEGKP